MGGKDWDCGAEYNNRYPRNISLNIYIIYLFVCCDFDNVCGTRDINDEIDRNIDRETERDLRRLLVFFHRVNQNSNLHNWLIFEQEFRLMFEILSQGIYGIQVHLYS